NRLIRCVCGKKIGPDPRNFNQRVSLGRNDLLIRTFLSGSLQVGIGRYKKMSLNNDPVYSVLTVGDQLLWGAAEPLRRMLNILLGKI
ncbi:hypothetical protein ACSGEF_25035, partial [Klebsiella pneumoniae]